MSKNIIFNYNLEKYKKKYRNKRYKLLSYSKQEVGNFNKFNNNKIDKDFLLKGRKWALIGETYYEIPKAPRWIWFRNLNAGVQTSVILLGSVGLASAVVFPTLFATIWKPITAGVSEKVKEYVQVETKEKLVVGESATIVLNVKEDKKTEAQLPKDPDKITVTTGGVKLPHWSGTSSFTNTVSNSICSSYSNSLVSNDTEEEPENYFKYTYTKDKADIWIKKILGPVEIDMVLEDRTYTVTLDPRNEIDTASTFEVLRGNKIQKPTITPKDEYRTLDGWYAVGSTEKFDFDKGIYSDVTVNAKYNGTDKSAVYIKGLKNINDTVTQSKYFVSQDSQAGKDAVERAYDAGKSILDNLPEMTEENFKNTFDDISIVEVNGKKRYLANISWYVFGNIEAAFSGSHLSAHNYFLSFGKTNKNIAENYDLYNTNLIGVTSNAKLTTTFCINSMGGSNDDTIDNPLNMKRIELENGGNNLEFVCSGSSFTLNIDGCTFNSPLYFDQHYKMNFNFENSTFKFNENQSYAIQFTSESPSREKEDTIVLKNNTFDGSKTGETGGCRKCVNFNDVFLKKATVTGNTFKKVHTNGEGKVGDSVLQISQGVEFDILNNTFEDCNCNVFMIHENITPKSNGVKLNINGNTITNCKYVGVNETGDSSVYNLNSSGNTISGTREDACGLDTLETTESKYILHIGH